MNIQDEYPLVTNPFLKAWIWFWYNDITRIFLVLLPGHYLLSVPLMVFMGLNGMVIKDVMIISYLLFFFWGMMDNNYSNLRRIGMTEHRKKIVAKN